MRHLLYRNFVDDMYIALDMIGQRAFNDGGRRTFKCNTAMLTVFVSPFNFCFHSWLLGQRYLRAASASLSVGASYTLLGSGACQC